MSTTTRTTRMWDGWVDGFSVIAPRVLEDHDCIVPSDVGTPWSYQPRGPFRVQMCHQSARPDLTSWMVSPDLGSAVAELVRLFVPPRQGYMCEVVDETFRQIICAAYHDAIWEYGGAWFGCRVGFDELRTHVDAISVDAWENIARQTAPGGGL